MENLSTIVFERTPEGAVAIKAAGDAVPRQLRTLLLAIDGRSPVSQYVPFLTALAPLSEKFAQLEVMGFARRRTADGSALAPSAHAPLPPLPLSPSITATPQEGRPAQQVTEAELRDFARQLPTTFSPPPAAPVANDFANELQAFARRNRSDTVDGTGSPTRTVAFVPKAASPLQANLASILAFMQAYLSEVAGLEGLPVALMLEQITSLAQLRRELSSYAELVGSYGGDPATHIKTLTGLLDEEQA